MSYPLSFKKRAIEYRKSGHSALETQEDLQVSISTIYRWERQLKEQGHLGSKPLVRPHKKIDPEKLRAYVSAHPDAFLKEIAQEFDCSITAIQKALKRLGIERKNHTSRL